MIDSTHSGVQTVQESQKDKPTNPTMTESLTGQDPPLEVAHPGLQPSLVFLSYPIGLVVIIMAFCAWYFLTMPSDAPAPRDGLPQQVAPDGTSAAPEVSGNR
jgi:hypothetical protein